MLAKILATLAVIQILIYIVLFLGFSDIGLGIVKYELGKFPDNIVYYVGESDTIDLTGVTLVTTTLEGSVSERPMSYYKNFGITDNVDFSVPGVYEVVIKWWPGGNEDNDVLNARIPIQVIERE